MGIAENIEWLRGFYARFDEDIEYLHQIESTWLPCKKCPDGHCCGRNSYFSLQRHSNPYVIEDWRLMLDYVSKNFSAEEKKQLAKNIVSSRTACIFMFQNRCSVYQNRPWGSRIHPYAISFAESASLFPAGKIAVPSCPSLAPVFGIKTDEEVVQVPEVIERHSVGHLVKVKLKKHRPVWLIDISEYVKEYEDYLSIRRPIVSGDIASLLDLAESAGGEYGGLLRLYLEQILGLRGPIELIPS